VFAFLAGAFEGQEIFDAADGIAQSAIASFNSELCLSRKLALLLRSIAEIVRVQLPAQLQNFCSSPFISIRSWRGIFKERKRIYSLGNGRSLPQPEQKCVPSVRIVAIPADEGRVRGCREGVIE